MKYIIVLFLSLTLQTYATLENTTCKKCHPTIYTEYKSSMHAKASIFNDPVHKAVWDKHPAKAKNNYKCAKCHTPADHNLIFNKNRLTNNKIQQTEPIACQTCHTIENIKKHSKANKNIFIQKKKYFFSADKEKKVPK